MATTHWTHDQARQYFFIYIERTGTDDLLHELRASPITPNPEVARLVAMLHEHLSSTAYATSVPFFTAMMGTHNGRTSAIQELPA